MLPPDLFRRLDESPDAEFYETPRFVTHIDDATIEALTALYRERIPPDAAVLDLMSSWVSHLPADVVYARVAGLGLNAAELARNPRLTERVVQDLNASPQLPWPDATFDAVVNAVSIQYLTRPVEVFTEVRRVLRPGGQHVVATSHRMFPTKAIAAWHGLEPADRLRLICRYVELAGGFDEPRVLDRSAARCGFASGRAREPVPLMPFAASYRPAPVFPTLGDGFFDAVPPADFPQHLLRYRNQRWAERVGLGDLTAEEWEAHFARFTSLPGNLPQPLALRYHGHQFRVYNAALGDGRGFLFAQLRDAHDGRLLDLATKGSGRTPWSRGGDGRLTLKGGVREVLATAMLDALGVPTSQSFSLFETGEQLERGDEPSPTRSSVLVRLSHSHVRFGTFQRLRYHDDVAGLRRLVEFSVEHYLPEAAGADDLPVALLRAVSARSARLCAAWMAAGFVHGVLNTDNMNVTGESFDYGPYRFLPTFDPDFTAAYFDPTGLYAYGHQPAVVHWNLARLADTLARLAPASALATALGDYESAFREAFRNAVLARLGLQPQGPDEDAMLVDAVVEFLDRSRIGVDRFFFDWYGGAASDARARASTAASLYDGVAFAALRRRLEPYAPRHPDRLALPYWQRAAPCSLLIDEIEALWAAVAERDDWTPLATKLDAIEELRRASEPLV